VETAVALEGLVRAAHRVEPQHAGAVRSLAEPIDRGGGLRMGQPRLVVAARQRGVGGLQVRAEHTTSVGAAQVLRPVGVWLVFEHVSAREGQRIGKQSPRTLRRRAPSLLEQLVKKIQVDGNPVDGEPVRLALRDEELTRKGPARAKMPAEHRDEGLEGTGEVLGWRLVPEHLGQPVRRHRTAPGCEQDLEDLLRATAAKVTRTEPAIGMLYRNRSEQPDRQTRVRVGRVHQSQVSTAPPAVTKQTLTDAPRPLR